MLTVPDSYNAKVHPHLPKLRALLAGLSEKANLHPEVVIVRHPFGVTNREQWDPNWKDWEDVVGEGREKKLGRTPDGEIEFKRLDFNWPLWILFSSGTTGACGRSMFGCGVPLTVTVPGPRRAKVAQSKVGIPPKRARADIAVLSARGAGRSSIVQVAC